MISSDTCTTSSPIANDTPREKQQQAAALFRTTTDAKEPEAIIQPLYRWGDRLLCSNCCDGNHRSCLGFGCTCYCLGPRAKRKRRPERSSDGLTAIQRRLQRDFAWNDYDACARTAH